MLDDKDNDILRLLQIDAGYGYAELGEKIHLSASSVHSRVKRLRLTGVIQQIVALLNREKAGFPILCFVHIALQSQNNDDVLEFEKIISAIPEVMECYYVTGEYDTILKVVARNHNHLQEILMNQLTGISYIARMQTSITLKEVKSSQALPL